MLATKLGGYAIKGAIEKCGLNQDQIDEVFMGNVLWGYNIHSMEG